MSASKATAMACVLVIGLLTSVANAAQVIQMVDIGNPGNTGELSGTGAGGSGPTRTCGAVSYTYRMGKFEVTAGQYTTFLNAVAKTDTYGLYSVYMADTGSSRKGCNIQQTGSGTGIDPFIYSVDSAWADRPVNWVSWGDAARFVNWLSNGQPSGAQNLTTTEDGSYYLNGATSNAVLLAVTRKANATWVIPSEDEWYKAAYHKNDGVTGNYFDYPTGTDSVPGRDMSEGTNPGNNANRNGTPNPIDSPHYTTLKGEFELSQSPYGTFDQGGNVQEWNEEILSSTARGLRGGSFSSSSDPMAAMDRSSTASPTYQQYAVGFRVVQVVELPEPATMALLAFGGSWMAARRRGYRGR